MSRSPFLIPLAVLAFMSPMAEARRVWPLSEEGSRTGCPALGVGGRTHEAIAAWSEDEGSRVVARVLATSGRPLSPERELAAAVDGEGVGAAAAAGRRAGYLVAWARGLGAVDVAALDRGGERVGPVRTIAEDSRSYLRVVYQPRAREYLVVWMNDIGSGDHPSEAVFARRLDRSGEPLGPAVMVSPRHTDIASYAVAPRRDGRGYLVAWNRFGPDYVAVEARALTGRAVPAGPVQQTARVNARASVALAWNGREGTFMLATHNSRYDVKLYRVNPDGSRRGRVHTVKPGPTVEQEPGYIGLAYERRSDTLLVVWREADPDGWPPFTSSDLQARRLAAADLETRGSPPIPSRTPSTYPDEGCPAVVAFRGGGYLVAWAGERGVGSGSRIFAQAL